jgi:hypothetical protein
MKQALKTLLATGMLFLAAPVATSANPQSVYTKLDLEKDCKFTETHEQGGRAVCTGYRQWLVHFSEGDLRQQVRYGFQGNSKAGWESFGQFNRINDTIEWRLENGKPYATILRWFIENMDPDTGAVSKKYLGNVLVISSVGTTEKPGSCIVGYVDARANGNANQIARDVADTLVRKFICGQDLPAFHGVRGELSGNPTSLR